MLHKKSKTTAVLLAFLLGPIGVLYAHALIGFIMIVIAIITASTVVIPLVLWLFGMFIAASAVDAHNKEVDEFKDLMTKR